MPMQQTAQTEEEPTSRAPASTTSQESPRRCSQSRRNSPSVTPNMSQQGRNATSWNRTSSSHRRPETIEPPVTRASLSELDVARIINNPRLRHDINFDPILQFRINSDGERCHQKKTQADEFWSLLRSQLEAFMKDPVQFYEKYGDNNKWCLPSLLKAAREIIQTLVPQRDRQFLDEGLNVELLMQQFYRGMLDLDRLAMWLSKVLKTHCAPMRDDAVDEMYETISTGNRTGNIILVVRGLRLLSNVLEGMKLDVANHQIRCLRPVLIDDTTPFQRRHFFKKIRSGEMVVAGAQRWYRDIARNPSQPAFPSRAFGDMSTLFDGISRLVLPSSADQMLPSTFDIDNERIARLRADMLDMINLEICMRTHRNAELVSRHAKMAESAHWTRPDEDVGSDEFDFNTPPTRSRPSSAVFSSAGSTGSSPRSSWNVPSYVAQDPESSNLDPTTKAKTLYSSLSLLLRSHPPSDLARPDTRWQNMASAMALQIFRFTSHVPSEFASMLEDTLVDSLSNCNSAIYADVEKRYHERISAALARKVSEFKNLCDLSLSKVATKKDDNGGLSHLIRDRDGDAAQDIHDQDEIEHMATRLAHMGILHWRTFADLYQTDAEVRASSNAPQPSRP